MRRLAQTASWLLLEKVLRVVSALVTSVWVARYLGPESFGELAFVLAFARIFSDVSALGLNALLVREFASEEADAGEVIGTALALRVLAGLVSGALAVVLVQLLRPDTPTLTVMVGLLATSFVFRSGEVFEHYFFALQRTRPPAVARMTGTAAFVACTLLLILLESPLVWFAAAKTAEFFVTNAGFLATYLRNVARIDWTASFRRARSLLGTSWPLILSGFGAMVNLRIDQVMLSQLSSASETGFYAAAAQLGEALYFVPAAIMMAAFPVLMRLRDQDPPAYRRRFQQAFDAMVWLGVAIALLVSLTAGVVVPFVYGDAYAAAVPMLVIHVWGAVFMFARAPLSKWIVAEKLTHLSLATHGAGAIVNVVVNGALIPAFGGVGAAAATVVSNAVASYFALFLWPRARPALGMMSLAALAPIRVLARWRERT